MSAPVEVLTCYVPPLVLRHVIEHPSALTAPSRETFSAAVFFADISGFTALSDQLAKRGPSGVEEITRLLNGYFGQLVELITSYGGETVKFAGDALLALWLTETGIHEDLTVATARAAECALAAQKLLHNYKASNVLLSLHIGIGAGDVLTLHIGGVHERREFLVTGPAIVQAGNSEQQAHPGDVVLSPEAWDCVADHGTSELLAKGYRKLTTVRTLHPVPPISSIIVPPETGTRLRSYIPAAILTRIDAGQTEWLAELRRTTVLFVNLPDLTYEIPLERAQIIMNSLQTSLYRYEGSINKLSIDDKGATLVAVLGLPPLAHENDATRGVQAGLAMQSELRQLGVRSSIGITTGNVFCGLVGGDTRREYTIMGPVVNLSARLMQAAHGDILCDTMTYSSSENHITFQALPAINVKGKTDEVPVYRPLDFASKPTLIRKEIVGRNEERARLRRYLDDLRAGNGAVVVVEGEAGIGKSWLMNDLVKQARALDIASVSGGGDAIEKSTPFYAWRSIFYEGFALDTGDSAVREQQLLDHLSSQPEYLRLAPLLNTMLVIDLPENELTEQLVGQVRADNTYELLVHLLRKLTATTPLLVILEDSHWLDSASWTLARLASRDVPNLLLVISTRPLPDPPAAYQQMLEMENTHQLPLKTLGHADTTRLICQCLGIETVAEAIADFIYEQGSGHPFFTEEVAYALRDGGLIRIVDGRGEIVPGKELPRTMDFPSALQGAIVSRIDHLTPQQQLALKVASVIGRSFGFNILRHIYPLETDKPYLGEYLNDLQQQELTRLEAAEPELIYAFKHVIIQEVVYNLMLFAQRRELHQAAAEWYEHTHRDDLASFYPLLAYHWRHTETPAKAIDYLDKAGKQALSSGAYQEAVGFFSDVLQLIEQAAFPYTTRQFALWQYQLGEAYLGLGRLRESSRHLEYAVSLLGTPIPSGRSERGIRLSRELQRQVFQRLRRATRQSSTGPREGGDAALEAARIYESLGQLYYFSNQTVAAVYAALRMLNLAEQALPSPELARAYATMSIAVGAVGWRSAAEWYSDQGLYIAQRLNHMPTLGFVMLITGSYAMGIAQWDKAQKTFARCIEIYEVLRDRRRGSESLTLLALQAYYQGDFARSADLYSQIFAAAQRDNNLLQQVWGLNGQAESLWRLGRTEGIVELLEAAIVNLGESIDPTNEIATYGLLAVVRLRQKQYSPAREAVETAARLMLKSSPVLISALIGYSCVAQALLGIWENDPARYEIEQIMWKRLTNKVCGMLDRYAQLFPIGKPRSHLYRGLYYWLMGKPAQAYKAWQKSLTSAKQLAMRYDEGLAHFELGRHLDHENPLREQHLAHACEIFEQIGASYDFECADTARTTSR